MLRRTPLGRPAVTSAVSRLSLVIVAATGLSGCFLADPDTSGIDVLNDTKRNLWLDDEPANSQSRRDGLEPHSWGKVGTEQCTTRRVEAQTRSGRVVATLMGRWCPGQDWIITAEGDFLLLHTP